MNSKSVSRQERLATHNGVLNPTLMCGSESWVWQKKNERSIEVVEMRSLRSMYYGVSRKGRCRDSDVGERCGLKEDVVTRVERGMLRRFGRLERMDESGLKKQIYRANVCDGQTLSSRPRRPSCRSQRRQASRRSHGAIPHASERLQKRKLTERANAERSGPRQRHARNPITSAGTIRCDVTRRTLTSASSRLITAVRMKSLADRVARCGVVPTHQLY
ncbi:hypothetical protein EVAR_79323_1 [Eumeta japonica]|uniref:Uncharacterized protein n=1 Tax=Eumeta variegata TaxID=151549 RepID=A0A4C1THT2_EUMVA|nr:hypothetical protein EVAR_79323_1 [Eumeta japonica]